MILWFQSNRRFSISVI